MRRDPLPDSLAGSPLFLHSLITLSISGLSSGHMLSRPRLHLYDCVCVCGWRCSRESHSTGEVREWEEARERVDSQRGGKEVVDHGTDSSTAAAVHNKMMMIMRAERGREEGRRGNGGGGGVVGCSFSGHIRTWYSE